MRRALALLGCLQVAFGRVGRYRYDLIPDGVLTGTPRETIQVDSHMMCASRCSKTHYVYCTSYSFTPDGRCLMYPTWCWATEPREAQPGVISYTKPTTFVWPCSQGGLALRNTCYFHRHSSTALTWEAAQLACAETLGPCSRLAQPKDRITYEFLMHTWRPNDEEWIGASDSNGDGLLTNLDGSQPSWQPPVVSHAAAGPVFLPAGYAQEVHRTTPMHASIHRYVCEAPWDCRLREPCQAGWVLLHGACYQLITDALTWDQANAHCGTLGRGGRLADIHSDLWEVLWEAFFQSSGGRVFLGVRDVEIEGYWVNVFNRTVGPIRWNGGQPDNNGASEHCLEMIGNLANDVTCTSTRQFICRVDWVPC